MPPHEVWGRCARAVMLGTGSTDISYRYNGEMQLDTLIGMWGGRTTVSYDADRLPTNLKLPTGLIESLGYPFTHRAASLRYSVPAIDNASGQGFRHDAGSRVAERVNVFADSSRAYSYDAAGRLSR